MRRVRLNEISLIPQGAMNSLSPVARVRKQIIDGIRDHDGRMTQAELNDRVEEVLEAVDLRPEVADMFPHELSGGMKQRVCVAIAISLRPKVIIADEPTSALDVVVQRQVMETIQRLQQELGISMILIGHDMGLMAQSVERLAVMYSGRLAELADVDAIFEEPLHPYTQLLISTLPVLGARRCLSGHSGDHPFVADPASRVPLPPRCPEAQEICQQKVPAWQRSAPVAGWLVTNTGVAMTSLLELRDATKVYSGGLFKRRATVALENNYISVSGEHPTILAIAGERQWQDHHGHAHAGLYRALQRAGALQGAGPVAAAQTGLERVSARGAGHLSGPLRGL